VDLLRKSFAENILFLKSLDADMIGLGPFILNVDTPLADEADSTFTTSSDDNY